MKKFISALFLVVLVVFIVISCKKETDSTTPTPIDTSKITFGNTEGMNVVTLDSIYLTNHPYAGYYYTENIDFDGDGLGDNIIRFEIIAGAWVGCGTTSDFMVKLLKKRLLSIMTHRIILTMGLLRLHIQRFIPIADQLLTMTLS